MFGFLTLFAPRSPSPHRRKNCEVAPKANESIFGVVGFFREINNLHTMPALKSGGRFVSFVLYSRWSNWFFFMAAFQFLVHLLLLKSVMNMSLVHCVLIGRSRGKSNGEAYGTIRDNGRRACRHNKFTRILCIHTINSGGYHQAVSIFKQLFGAYVITSQIK